MQISDIMAREVAFALFDVVGMEDLSNLPRFESHNRETYEAVLETARKIADDYFAPHNRKGDLNEPRVVNGVVELIPEVAEAMDAYREAGFFAAHQQEGTWAGGIHVELTGDSVTECVGGGDGLEEAALDQAYETMCDPRLNGRQSVDLAFMVAELLRAE